MGRRPHFSFLCLLWLIPFLLEVHPSVQHKTPSIACRGDLPECAHTVDVHAGVSEIRVIQDVDGVETEFEVGVLTAQPEPFDHVHVKTEATGTFHRCKPHGTYFAGLRIHENGLTIRSKYSLVAVRGVQAVRGCNACNTWIL